MKQFECPRYRDREYTVFYIDIIYNTSYIYKYAYIDCIQIILYNILLPR